MRMDFSDRTGGAKMRDTKADAETEMKRRTFPVYTEKVLDLRC